MARNTAAYDKDFYAWTAEQARLLRAREFSAVDVENRAEEIESIGRRDRREIESRLIVLLAHLLKWRHQPDERSPGWSGTIRGQRRQLEKLLRESPSLRPAFAEAIPDCCSEAREEAAEEAGLPVAAFPAACPLAADQILARDFLPGA